MNKFDFFRAIEHEMGHVFNLEHTYDDDIDYPYTDMMYALTNNYTFQWPFANREVFFLRENSDAVTAAKNIIARSRVQTWSFPVSSGLKVFSSTNAAILAAPTISLASTTASQFILKSSVGANNFWIPTQQTTQKITVDRCIKNTYYVRLKNSSCSLASLPSIGFDVIPPANCIDTVKTGRLILYPNPATDVVNVKFELDNYDGSILNSEITITNTIGNIVKYENFISNLEDRPMSIITLPTGLYNVQWKVNGRLCF